MKMTIKELKASINKRLNEATAGKRAKDELQQLLDAVEFSGPETVDAALAALRARVEQPDLADRDLDLFLQYVEDGARLMHEEDLDDDDDDDDDDDSYEGRADPSSFFDDAQGVLDDVFTYD